VNPRGHDFLRSDNIPGGLDRARRSAERYGNIGWAPTCVAISPDGLAVRARPSRSRALSVSHSKFVLYGGYVWCA
jgi:hypothetical protein